jgi:hypothetical protein
MKNLHVISHPEVKPVFDKYPEGVRKKLWFLRSLILETASEIEDISELEETLKWGEPSYLVKNGSTLRMDWKEKNPEYYALYFKCTSKLVPSFKEAFSDTFTFEGDRAIVFKLDESVPVSELKKCIKATLQYHKVKHLPLLGLE